MPAFDRPSASRARVSLARGEVAERGVRTPPLHEAGHDGGVDDAFALGHAAQGIDKNGDVGDPFLEQVAKPAGLVGKQPLGVARLEVLAEHDDCRRRVLLPDAASRDQALVGVGRRHPDVDDRDIRIFQGDQAQERIGVGRFPDHVDPGVGEQSSESRPDQHDVIGNYDPHGITAVTTVAPVAVFDMVSCPPRAPTRSATSMKSVGPTAPLPASTSARSFRHGRRTT
jgi:hypothetical protein